MQIGSASVSDGVYFIAEAGVNHNGDLALARDLIDVAAESGADAIKFQTFSADRLVTRDAEQASYQDTDDASQYEMLKRYELSRSDHEALQQYCREQGITFLSTPFDEESLELLDDLGVPAIKLGSGELTNLPLLRAGAKLGRPLIVSTGMATMDEVKAAYECLTGVDSSLELALLHCVSAYPTAIEDLNLRAMQSMQEAFPTPIGLSDHTTSVEIPAIAVGAGATIIEKHFTVDRSLPGPDHEASLEPGELDRCISLVRSGTAALGSAEKRPVEAELDNRSVARKSLHAARTLEPGTRISEDEIAIVRPADGLSPDQLSAVTGRAVSRRIDAGEPLTQTCFDTHRDSNESTS